MSDLRALPMIAWRICVFSHITLPGEYTIAGAQALYERENELEKLRIPGPIKEAIVIYVSFKRSFLS